MDPDDILYCPFNFGTCKGESVEMTVQSAVFEPEELKIEGFVRKRGEWVTVTIPTFQSHSKIDENREDLVHIHSNLKEEYLTGLNNSKMFGCQMRIINPISKYFNTVPALVQMDKTGEITITPWNSIKYKDRGVQKLKTVNKVESYKEVPVGVTVFGFSFTYSLYHAPEEEFIPEYN